MVIDASGVAVPKSKVDLGEEEEEKVGEIDDLEARLEKLKN